MTFEELLRLALLRLDQEKVRYALAGGLAISIYRKQTRATNDIDFLILAESKTAEMAEEIIASFGLTPHLARKADLEGGPFFAIKKKNTPPYIVVGRKSGDDKEPGLDFILPEMPWFHSALERAEKNRIDFGIATIPTLTVEDIVLSKFYSFSNNVKRFNDLSDLQDIFAAKHALDLSYLTAQMKVLHLQVPRQIADVVPKELRRISKSIKRSK